jgi:hypothetical protein
VIEVARGRHSLAELAIAPALLVLGWVIWLVSDRLVIIGPFDRAQVEGVVVVPLLALAPGAAALAGRRTGRPRLAGLVVAGVSIGVAVFVLIELATSITFLECRPVTSPVDVVPRVLAIAIVSGFGFAIPAAAAWGPAQAGRTLLALAVGAIVWMALSILAIGVFVVSFPALSCVPPQG